MERRGASGRSRTVAAENDLPTEQLTKGPDSLSNSKASNSGRSAVLAWRRIADSKTRAVARKEAQSDHALRSRSDGGDYYKAAASLGLCWAFRSAAWTGQRATPPINPSFHATHPNPMLVSSTSSNFTTSAHVRSKRNTTYRTHSY